MPLPVFPGSGFETQGVMRSDAEGGRRAAIDSPIMVRQRWQRRRRHRDVESFNSQIGRCTASRRHTLTRRCSALRFRRLNFSG